MLKISIQKTKLLAFAIFFCCGFSVSAQTPVAKYGQLKIFNGKVSDKNNNPVVLRGVSLFWSGYPEGAPFYNAQTIKWLRDDWCVDVVRASMSVETGNSTYIGNPGAEIAKIKTVIQACIDNGLYVVVDFHSHNAANYTAQAKTFFTDIATTYGNTPNVLYEPYNEPISQSWSGVVKPYHNEIIQTIRAKDPDNIIICGTTNYSQDVDIAANDQVTGTNVAYTLHYYANSHQGSLRQKATNALNKGVAIFVTEYGTTNASGDGGYNPTESQVWWDFVEANKLSTCNWSIGNKGETSAILTQGTSSLSGWTSNQITTSGALVKDYIKKYCNVTVASGSVTLSFTGNKTQFNKGESVTITAAATVSTGIIAHVDFFNGTTLLGSATTPPYTFTSITLPSGGLNITAKSYTSTGALIGVSQNYTINIVGSSNVSTTGVTDQFESATQYSELTGAINGTSCATATSAAATGVYWFEDLDAATPFKAVATRSGDGKLKYLISQAAKSYNVVGFNFGEYCSAGLKKKYTLDLSGNAVLQLTVNTPATNTATLDLKIQMKDANGIVLAINKTILKPDGTVDKTNTVASPSTWYKYEIGYSKSHDAPGYVALTPGTISNFTFDFKNALTLNNPNNPTFPNDINNNNSTFDFTKVVEVVIIPVNSLSDVNYDPLAFADQQIIFSGLSLGDPSLGVDICTTPPPLVPLNVSYCQDATDAIELTATGILGLTQKWYTTLSGGTGGDVVPIPSTNTPGKITYYVSQATSSISTCEGPRSPLDVNVVAASTSNAGVAQTNAKGPSITLTGSGSAVGTWKLVSGQPGATVSFAPSANSASVTANGLSVLGDYTFSYSVAGTTPCLAAPSNVVVTVTTITALENDAYLNEIIEIYPNPASDNLFVNLSKVNGSKSMKMMDMFGRVVYESANQNSFNVDMSGLNKGMYIVQIQGESGKLSRSVIKQ